MPVRSVPMQIPFAALLALGYGCVAVQGAERPSYERLHPALVAEGRRIWSTSLDPGNPVACATCHFDELAIREWAPSFPKLRPEPPPYSRVVTLVQTNASAIRLHYRIEDPLPAATAVTAFLRAIGGSLPVSPGVARGQPIIPSRLDRLRASARRGRDLLTERCVRCHQPDHLARIAATFPRSTRGPAESFEGFVGRHAELAWDGPEMADLSAELFARLEGTSLDAAMEKEARISGEVRDKAGRPLAGLALMEKGQIHNNVWHAGARVSEDGRFEISLPEGGEYGLHVYSSGYIYSPQSVMLEAGKTKALKVVMAPEPTRANDPVLEKVEFSPSPDAPRRITLHVSDPNGDLGPQVLAFNAATGRPFAMTPPTPVKDLKANFPNGAYRLEVPTQRSGSRNWYFVVADHRCNTTDVLAPPHQPGKPAVVR